MTRSLARVPYTAEQIEVCDRRVRKTCHPKQRAFVFDPGRRVSCVVGRGGGKTAGMLLRLLRRMVSRCGQNCLFIASTRQSAERLVWKDLKRIVSESLRLSGAIFNESDLTLELPNGSALLLFGCDDKSDIQKLRGITYHEVGIDEVASIKIDLLKELLGEVIGPRMVGALCLIGTPGKRLEGLFYDATRPGSPEHRRWEDRDLAEYVGWKKWSSHTWNIKDGVDAGIEAMEEIYAAQLEEIDRQGYSETNPYRRREYDGEWASDDSTNVFVYRPHHEDGTEKNQWTPKLTAARVAILPDTFKDWGYGIGIDVGFKDAFALEVFAFSFADPSRMLYHVYEVYRQRMYANAIAKLLIGEDLNHDKYGGLVADLAAAGLPLWPDVMVGDFAGAGAALLTELATVYGITIKAADKPYRYKDNSIELLNSTFHDGRIKIMKGSNLATELTSLQWVVDAYGKRAENKAQANHATDATLYLRDALSPMLASATGGGSPPTALAPAAAPAKKREAFEDEPPEHIERPDGYEDADFGFEPGNW